jgi:periplasmic copper chaperone A
MGWRAQMSGITVIRWCRAYFIFGVMFAVMFSTACRTERTINVSNVYVVTPAGDAPAVMYLTLTNETDHADTLVGVTTPAAQRAELHEESNAMRGMMHGVMHGTPGMSDAQHVAMMRSVAAIPLAPGATVRLAPGGYHVMLMQPAAIQRGGTVPVTLRLARIGTIQATARVIGYADVDSAVGRVP